MFVFSHVQSSLKQTWVCVQKSKVWKWNSSDPVVLLARQSGGSRSVLFQIGDCHCCPSITHPQPAACQVGPWTRCPQLQRSESVLRRDTYDQGFSRYICLDPLNSESNSWHQWLEGLKTVQTVESVIQTEPCTQPPSAESQFIILRSS